MSAVALANGIALSTDGRIWTAGAGDYGKGWGNVGEGISVPAGSTIYIKYYSASRDGRLLNYAVHGAEWGNWHKIGPGLADDVGNGSAKPIILRVDDVGTSKSTATWVNGTGTWSGIPFPGAYDFGFDHDARWTLPPLVIRPAERTWWGTFWTTSRRGEAAPNSTEGMRVPDNGGTALLLGCALLIVALLWRGLRRRAAKRDVTTLVRR